MPLSRINAQSLTDASIVSAEIADGAITTAKLADNAVTTAKVNPTQTDITSVGTLTSFRSTGIDDNADALAMTIDSSERVLIGMTTASGSTDGIQFVKDGRIFSNVDGSAPLILNRKTSNGGIATFRKDGTDIGSIGVTSNDQLFLTRTTGSQGIKLKNSALMPANADGGDSDNDQDLGSSSVRWKDLYLSSGVRVGGTGTANLLDDYEEGTWTPVVSGSSSGIYAIDSGFKARYTKIGAVCHVSATFGLGALSGSASGYTAISGFPFSYNGALSQAVSTVACNNVDLSASCIQLVIAQNSSGTSTAFFLTQVRDATTAESLPLSSLSSSSDFTFSVTYQVA